MKNKLKIIKIGGNIIDDEDSLDQALKDFVGINEQKILVHGGGKPATDISRKLGLETKMSGGRRITTAEGLNVVTMVYSGLINKKVVAKLQALGCNALGLSGADANTIVSGKRAVSEVDFGFVGDIQQVNSPMIDTFLKDNLTPVFSAITHNKKGQLLNTNADTVASQIAIAMSELYETELVLCFEKKGVLKNITDLQSVIPVLDSGLYAQLVKKGLVHSGMLPKLQVGFEALRNSVASVIIGDTTIIGKERDLFTKLVL